MIRSPLRLNNSSFNLAYRASASLPISYLRLRPALNHSSICRCDTGRVESRHIANAAKEAGAHKVSRKKPSSTRSQQKSSARPGLNTPLKALRKAARKKASARKEALEQYVQRMKSKVEVLTTPTADTPGTSLLLEYPDKTYLIGHAHEACQRAMMQRGKRLNKVTDLFLTGKVVWENIGGVLGIVLTAADIKSSALKSAQENVEEKRKRKMAQFRKQLLDASNNPKKREKAQERINEEKEKQAKDRAEEAAARRNGEDKDTLGIHGGRNLMYAIACGRRYIFRKGMPLDVREFKDRADPETWTPTWSDSNIEVYAMPILPLGCSEMPADDRRDQILKGIVHDMFDSTWRLDQLFEMDLKDVRMPAKIFFRDEVTRRIKPWKGPEPGKVPAEELPEVKVLVRKPWPAALVGDLPGTKPSEVAMSYIVRGYPQRGEFLIDKAKALGLPISTFRPLTQGQSVTLENGQTVNPDQVLGPGKPGTGFAVVDLPSVEYINNLIERPEWKSERLMESLEGIFWLLGPGVEEHSSFQEFVKGMPLPKHVISAQNLTPNYLAFESAATIQLRLATIDSSHHPVLEFDDRPTSALPDGLQHCAIAHPGQLLQLQPRGSWETVLEVPPLDCAAKLREIPKRLVRRSKIIEEEIEADAEQLEMESRNLPGAEAEIITLGTGSASPSKYRNVSGTLLRVPGRGSYLFDAGEGTMGQLARMFKPEELLEILKDLRMIWISHMHADHHLGTMSVIKAWRQAVHPDQAVDDKGSQSPSATTFEEDPSKYLKRGKLALVSDHAMIHYVKEYFAMENVGHGHVVGISVVPAGPGAPESTRMFWGDHEVGFNVADANVRKAIREMTGLEDLRAAVVEHCNGSRAVSIGFSDGFKVSYSGDCRPSKRFVEIGKGSTLLIHEATFDDELSGDAKAKKHSTVSEAIRVGIEMGVQRIMLTHFSQRYSKIAKIQNIAQEMFQFEDADPDASDDGTAGDVPDEDVAVDKGPETSGLSEAQVTTVPASKTSVTDGVLERIRIGAAVDYMRVKVKDIAKLERYTPVVNQLFDSEAEESDGEVSNVKKRKKRE